MPDENITSFEVAKRKQSHDRMMAMLKPGREAMEQLRALRKAKIRYIAGRFGLPEGDYNPEILYCLMDASLDLDEAPPFKLDADPGWMFRGYELAHLQRFSENTWYRTADRVITEANAEWDDLTRRNYADC